MTTLPQARGGERHLVGSGDLKCSFGGAHRRMNPIRRQVGSSEAGIGSWVSYLGESHEWHLVFANSFEHFEFGFVSWFLQEDVLLVSPFSEARFESVRSISDAVNCDGIE